MFWLIAIGCALGGLALCSIASTADDRMAAMWLERVQRLYRVANGTATERDYADTTLYEMENITHAEDFATFCERNGFRV